MSIDWVGIIEHCQWAAAEGLLVTNLFDVEPQGEFPASYKGGGDVWPSKQQVFRHFCEHPDAWELLRRGYEWRSFTLHDKIEGVRRRVEKGTIDPRRGKVVIDTCIRQLDALSAQSLREERQMDRQAARDEKAKRVAAKQPPKPEDTIAARLAQAEVDEVVKNSGSQRKPRPAPATEWGKRPAGNA